MNRAAEVNLRDLSAVGKIENGEKVDADPKLVGTASLTASFINVLKAILGAGILSLPKALAVFGLLPGVFLVILAAFASAFGLHLYALCASFIGRKSSFAEVSKITYPRADVFLDMTIILKCIGVALSYLIIVSKLTLSFISGYNIPENSIFLSRQLYVLLPVCLLILPLSLLKKLDSLKYSSFLGSVAIVYLAIAAVVRAFFEPRATAEHLRYFVPINFDSLAYFGSIVFSFTCHQIMFPIHNETRKNSIQHLTMICSLAVGVAAVLYLSFGVSTYVTFADQKLDSVFDLYSNTDLTFQLARVLFVLLLIFSYPLQVVPFRMCTMKYLKKILPDRLALSSKVDLTLHILSTLAIVSVTTILAILMENTGKVFNLVGAMTSSIICYLIPFFFYMKLSSSDGFTPKRIFCVGIGILGFLSFTLCSLSSIKAFFV